MITVYASAAASSISRCMFICINQTFHIVITINNHFYAKEPILLTEPLYQRINGAEQISNWDIKWEKDGRIKSIKSDNLWRRVTGSGRVIG